MNSRLFLPFGREEFFLYSKWARYIVRVLHTLLAAENDLFVWIEVLSSVFFSITLFRMIRCRYCCRRCCCCCRSFLSPPYFLLTLLSCWCSVCVAFNCSLSLSFLCVFEIFTTFWHKNCYEYCWCANLFLGTLWYSIERTLTLTLDCQFSFRFYWKKLCEKKKKEKLFMGSSTKMLTRVHTDWFCNKRRKENSLDAFILFHSH